MQKWDDWDADLHGLQRPRLTVRVPRVPLLQWFLLPGQHMRTDTDGGALVGTNNQFPNPCPNPGANPCPNPGAY